MKTYAGINLTDDEVSRIRSTDGRIKQVKIIRDLTGLGLKDAIDVSYAIEGRETPNSIRSVARTAPGVEERARAAAKQVIAMFRSEELLTDQSLAFAIALHFRDLAPPDAGLRDALELCWQATGEAYVGDVTKEKLLRANRAARAALGKGE